MKTMEERFWAKVDKGGAGGCWIWTAGRNKYGYGLFRCEMPGERNPEYVLRSAHRVAVYLSGGKKPLPEGLFVCHTCDNHPCVNPAHLFLGTPKDNVQDMVKKGRATGPNWMVAEKKMKERERLFWLSVEKTDGCWNWTGRLSNSGYGSFDGVGLTVFAHRFSWRLAYGTNVPPGQVLRHSCDNKLCVNPAHLTPGTQKENLADQRRSGILVRGELVGTSKLTEAQVRQIKSAILVGGRNGQEIADAFSVSKTQVSAIRRGVSWATVSPTAAEIEAERQAFPPPIGLACHPKRRYVGSAVTHRTSLNEDNVRLIKLLYLGGKASQKDLAEQFGINQAGISAIVTGRTWKHVKLYQPN